MRPNGDVDLQTIAATIPDGLLVVDAEGGLIYVNEFGAAMIGLRPQDCIGHNAAEFVHPDDLALVLSSIESMSGKDRGTPIEVRVSAPGGEQRLLEIVGRDLRHVPGVNGYLCTGRDLTERRMWEVAGSDVTRFQQVVHHAAAIVMHLSDDGVVTSVNGAFCRILGHDPTMVVGHTLQSFAAPGYEAALGQALDLVSPGHTVTIDVQMRGADHHATVPIRLEFVDTTDDPVVAGLVVTGQDITELHQARLDLEHLATHDPLTGLANRTLLDAHLKSLVERGQALSVTYIDLDGFKAVNDQFGHQTGDELLSAVARRLQNGVASSDMVARRGGDEFVVVADNMPSAEHARAFTDRLTALAGSPYQLSVGDVRIKASAGTTWWSPGAGERPDTSWLLAQADAAMYRTKSRAPADHD